MKEGWQTKKLGVLCEIELGKTPARANSAFWDEKRETGNVWLSIADLLKAEDNIVWELGGRQALEVLREVLTGLSPTDQELAQHSIFVGLVINEMKPKFGTGDFLIRTLVGIDPPSGAIAVADPVSIGQTLQFHLRDPSASREDLRRLLAEHSSTRHAAPPAGALLFNCLGRGKSFYGTAHHDLKTIRTFSGKLPVGGFFCNGEIGPVGRTNFLHGYTASLGLFRPSERPAPEGA